MKNICGILIILFSLLVNESYAQVKCYRFSLTAQSPDWRDSSCVACTSDPDVIADVNQQLSIPFMQRNKHINGAIAAGNAYVNKNAHYNFLWHFKVNEWSLREMSMEVCDGRPYSDVDLDTAYWLNTIGFFCPWSSIVAAEIPATGLRNISGGYVDIALYPNPASDKVSVAFAEDFDGHISIYDLRGYKIYNRQLNQPGGSTAVLDISGIANGQYVLRLEGGNVLARQKFSIVR